MVNGKRVLSYCSGGRPRYLRGALGVLWRLRYLMCMVKYISISFFYALKPCIDGSLEGCRSHLSIDSTTFNGRWNDQLAAGVGVDSYNWM